jgi:acyl-CoA dehydrogenase
LRVISPGKFSGRISVDLGVTDKVRPLVAAVRAMVRDEIMPLEADYEAEVGREGDRFKPTKRIPIFWKGARARPIS